MGLWRGYCHSSWKASLLPTFHISWSEWASALDGCDQPPGPRTPCAHTPPRGAVPLGQSLERTTHPSHAPGRCCGGRSRPGWCGWTSPGSIAVPPWIHPGSGIGSRAFGRSSQSHCELRNGPCYSDIQLEFQECEVGSLARFGERRNCHLWGRPREITDVYNWNTKKKKKPGCIYRERTRICNCFWSQSRAGKQRGKCCGIEKARPCHEQKDRRLGWEYPRLKPTGEKSWHG